MAARPTVTDAESLGKELVAASPDLLGSMVKVFAEALMSAEVDGICGADYGEVTPERVNRRNGYRMREWDTRAGTVELAVPKLRQGSYFPEWLLDGRVVNVHCLLAVGVNGDGHREILGLDVVSSEDGAGWLAFFRGLVARGLSGVRLVTSDAHRGLVAAIGSTLPGASWQRCRTHYLRDLLTFTPKSSQQIWSSNPQERLNKEICRRTDVVDIFPNRDAIVRLVGAVLAEQHDEWVESHRYIGLEILAKSDAAGGGPHDTPEMAVTP